MIQIEHTAHSPAPRSDVWRKLADLQNWHQWGPWTKTDIDGDIRTMVSDRKRLNGKPYVMTERVTKLEPQERLDALWRGAMLKVIRDVSERFAAS